MPQVLEVVADSIVAGGVQVNPQIIVLTPGSLLQRNIPRNMNMLSKKRDKLVARSMRSCNQVPSPVSGEMMSAGRVEIMKALWSDRV
jgi:hypothetical protein